MGKYNRDRRSKGSGPQALFWCGGRFKPKVDPISQPLFVHPPEGGGGGLLPGIVIKLHIAHFLYFTCQSVFMCTFYIRSMTE